MTDAEIEALIARLERWETGATPLAAEAMRGAAAALRDLRADQEGKAGWLAQWVIDKWNGTDDLPAWVRRSAAYYRDLLAGNATLRATCEMREAEIGSLALHVDTLRAENARLWEALSDAASELPQVAGSIANRITVYREHWQERCERAEAALAAAQAHVGAMAEELLALRGSFPPREHEHLYLNLPKLPPCDTTRQEKKT